MLMAALADAQSRPGCQSVFDAQQPQYGAGWSIRCSEAINDVESPDGNFHRAQTMGPSGGSYAMHLRTGRAGGRPWFLFVNKLLLDHCSTLYQSWTFFIFFMTGIVAFWTPFEIAYVRGDVQGLYDFNFAMNIIFWIDLFINFRLTAEYYDHSRHCVVRVDDGKKLALMYLRGWFIIDFLSVFPFEALAWKGGSNMRLLRCLRLVKLLRIVRCSRFIKNLQQAVSLSYAVQDFLAVVLLTCLACHVIACMFGLVNFLSAHPEPDGWVLLLVDKGRLTEMDCCMQEYDLCPAGSTQIQGKLYTYAFYWAIATVTTIGYGDLYPQTVEECA